MTRHTTCTTSRILVTHASLLHILTAQVYMHVLVLSSCHMDHRAYYMYFCSIFPYSCYMIDSCYNDMDIPDTGHESCWYAICGLPHLLFMFPVILFMLYCSWFPLYCSMLSTELWSSYHVTCIMYCYLFLSHCILDIADNNDNLGMRDTWRLIRSYRVMYWIHIVSPTAGDGSATYQLLHELPLLDYCSPLSGGPWSQQPGVRLRPWSRVYTGYIYPIRAPRLWVSN